MEKKQQILIIHGGDTYSNYDEYLEAREQKKPFTWNECSAKQDEKKSSKNS